MIGLATSVERGEPGLYALGIRYCVLSIDLIRDLRSKGFLGVAESVFSGNGRLGCWARQSKGGSSSASISIVTLRDRRPGRGGALQF